MAYTKVGIQEYSRKKSIVSSMRCSSVIFKIYFNLNQKLYCGSNKAVVENICMETTV